MSVTWDSGVPPDLPPIAPTGWVRVVLRGLALAVVVFGGLIVLLLMRLVERPLAGQGRPVTPRITRGVCQIAFTIMGLHRQVRGAPMAHPGAVVANHTSWLDIFALNADHSIYFVSKAEVAGWPGIGWLARATGTVFIERTRAKALAQTEVLRDRFLAGHRLLFFPEGTSTDGQQVLPFKSTLFEAFFAPGIRDVIWVQPVTLDYIAPEGLDPRFYGWWGDTSFGVHLLATLAPARQGLVTITYHPPLRVADFADRKTLARACESAVRAGRRAA